ncbi:MAG: inorganic phosphate transporter, partial [Campylobacteraceae bacterium]|nr:inorganic phosphate transporter [Campylobacteraceae bacterium]
MDLKTTLDARNVQTLIGKSILKLLIGIAFILTATLFAYFFVEVDFPHGKYMLVAAVFFGCYMALNIGANDVANNVGPAVGAKAISLFWAIVLAAIFELSGALIAGSDVVQTIKGGIVDQSLISDPNMLVWIMMAALLGGAVWLNIATYMGVPVSTTHAIVGGVAGAGVAAMGYGVIKWFSLLKIVSSWIVSPLLGGIIAAGLLYFIKRSIMQKEDKKAAAKKIVPFLIALMFFAFSAYLLLKGLKSIVNINFGSAVVIGAIFAVIAYFISKPLVVKTSDRLPNSRRAVNWLFNFPLIFAAAMLSFAHGANDVS